MPLHKETKVISSSLLLSTSFTSCGEIISSLEEPKTASIRKLYIYFSQIIFLRYLLDSLLIFSWALIMPKLFYTILFTITSNQKRISTSLKFAIKCSLYYSSIFQHSMKNLTDKKKSPVKTLALIAKNGGGFLKGSISL